MFVHAENPGNSLANDFVAFVGPQKSNTKEVRNCQAHWLAMGRLMVTERTSEALIALEHGLNAGGD